MGRVRLARLLAADEPNLIDFVEDVVAPGAIVTTDGWSGYHNLETASLFGYRHVVDNLSAKARENPDDPKMPNVHRVTGNLKRGSLARPASVSQARSGGERAHPN